MKEDVTEGTHIAAWVQVLLDPGRVGNVVSLYL